MFKSFRLATLVITMLIALVHLTPRSANAQTLQDGAVYYAASSASNNINLLVASEQYWPAGVGGWTLNSTIGMEWSIQGYIDNINANSMQYIAGFPNVSLINLNIAWQNYLSSPLNTTQLNFYLAGVQIYLQQMVLQTGVDPNN